MSPITLKIRIQRRKENLPNLLNLMMLVFWVVAQCETVGRYRRFGGTYCLYLEGFKMEAACSSKTLVSIYKSTLCLLLLLLR
jgi:hypothetical protein